MPRIPKAPPLPGPPPMSAARGRGRPRDPELRERILKAATVVFLKHGASVSVDKVAEAAGTSKVTLYSYFPSKEALFDAMLTQPVAASFDVATQSLDPNNPQAALLHIANAFLELITSPDVIAQVHVLYEGARKTPSLGLWFFESGPHAITVRLAEFLASVPSLEVPEPMVAAEQFLAMARGNEQMRALLALPPARKGARQTAYLASCATLFVTAYAAKRP